MSDAEMNTDHGGCQLMANVGVGSEPVVGRLLRISRKYARGIRRWAAVRTRLRRFIGAVSRKSRTERALIPGEAGAAPARQARAGFACGDLVRVRSAEEIARTLDARGACRGCGFLKPMTAHCRREYRIAKIVRRFFDERRWRMLRCDGVVLLEGVHCDGSGHPDTHGCDRMCYFFWRTEWLEPVSRSDERNASSDTQVEFETAGHARREECGHQEDAGRDA
jgi:hypothetical protein